MNGPSFKYVQMKVWPELRSDDQRAVGKWSVYFDNKTVWMHACTHAHACTLLSRHLRRWGGYCGGGHVHQAPSVGSLCSWDSGTVIHGPEYPLANSMFKWVFFHEALNMFTCRNLWLHKLLGRSTTFMDETTGKYVPHPSPLMSASQTSLSSIVFTFVESSQKYVMYIYIHTHTCTHINIYRTHSWMEFAKWFVNLQQTLVPVF